MLICSTPPKCSSSVSGTHMKIIQVVQLQFVMHKRRLVTTEKQVIY